MCFPSGKWRLCDTKFLLFLNFKREMKREKKNPTRNKMLIQTALSRRSQALFWLFLFLFSCFLQWAQKASNSLFFCLCLLSAGISAMMPQLIFESNPSSDLSIFLWDLHTDDRLMQILSTTRMIQTSMKTRHGANS